MDKKVSVIIPARNEEKFLERAIKSIRNQSYKNTEIIVVVNGSTDKTIEIAEKNSDKVLNFKDALGYNIPRNEGAKIARGEVLLFLDADTQLSNNVILQVVDNITPTTVGTCLCRPDTKSIKARLFVAFKNFIHRTKIFKSVSSGGVIFCNKKFFFQIGGFGTEKNIGEFCGFIKKAEKNGGEYKYLTNCYAIVSMRRYEERGYLIIFWIWIKYRIGLFFGGGEKTAKKYILNEKK
ncbi:MAG: glycosyltransferase [Candidatus Staskawiczbacteria bacterium]|nr:glycosyltransferase [Candidatus Staskawiczbacteria bacterium]